MVNYQSGDLDALFSALGHPTRRAILAQLSLGDASVNELAAPYQMPLPAVSKHLRVLEGAGLLHKSKQGRVVRCRLNGAPLKSAMAWIEHYSAFWEGRFDALEAYLGAAYLDKTQNGETEK